MSNNFSIITDLSGVLTAVADVETLTAKERSLLGLGVCPGFQDNFNMVGNNQVPDATKWSIVENGGNARVRSLTADVPGYCRCQGNGTAGNDALVYSQNKRVIALKTGVTTLHILTTVNFDWTGNAGGTHTIGFLQNDTTPTSIADWLTAGIHSACFTIGSSVCYSGAANAGGVESTDLSAFVADNTYYEFEIVISSTDVEYYIDGTLRDTLNTRVPDSVLQVGFGVTDVAVASEKMYVQKIQVWGE